MNRLQDHIIVVCKKYPEIAFAYLFGSYATGEQTAMSDIDIAIYLEDKTAFPFNKLLMFQGDCCRVLKRNDVDVLILNTTKNLILQEEIIRHGKIIYSKNHQFLDDFELRTLHTVYDFKEQRRREMSL